MDKGPSIFREQQRLILDTIKRLSGGDWKILVLDETSKRIVDNAVKEQDILNRNIANIERLEEKRETVGDMDAIYILSPQEHSVGCLLADFDQRRYRKAYLVWTGVVPAQVNRVVSDKRSLIAGYEVVLLEFYPRESHLVTFRDPWSFPIIYHRDCDSVVQRHVTKLAQQIMSVCVALGEVPKVRFYVPQNAPHRAQVFCSFLAKAVQKELDDYQAWNANFPPPSSRPQGVLVITDRSMDLLAPLLHEFTYQAMAHDLLPIRDGDKVTFRMTINEGTPEAAEKDMELGDKDRIWVENRHRHMKDTIEKLQNEFRSFLKENGAFSGNADATNLNVLKDMLAGLPQFQEMKEAYALHFTMAQDSMSLFEKHKLPDIALAEQTLATGLDEDGKKAKNVLDQVVRLLDDDMVTARDRLRLLLLYLIWRNGTISPDVEKLLQHAALGEKDGVTISNLEELGIQARKDSIKEQRGPRPPPFTVNTKLPPPIHDDEYSLSRFEPALKGLLEELCRGTLDKIAFPYVHAPADEADEAASLMSQTSLRAAAPRWASANRRQVENRQRLLVFMAGGATYSEARTCYQLSEKQNRDIYLLTSHMLTPAFFLRQLSDLSLDRRQLDLPQDRPVPRIPEYLRAPPPPPPMPAAPRPSTGAPGTQRPPGLPAAPRPADPNLSAGVRLPRPPQPGEWSGLPTAAADEVKPGKEKKKRGLFGRKK